ncbi:MAG: hypothetical protein FJ121_06055 [Deltaproteobacteria bacterium]|nr:hypothetical protein [Deltaproteobacteria bacterium]
MSQSAISIGVARYILKYNVLFAEQDGSRSKAQIKAFEDTWRWDEAAVATYKKIVESGGNISKLMQALHGYIGGCDMQ